MIIAADPLCYAVILISTTDQRERPYGSTEHAGLDHGSTPTCAWPRLWRIEMGMEQALSPQVDSVLRPHSGLRGRDYTILTDWRTIPVAWRCWRRIGPATQRRLPVGYRCR